MFATDDDEGDVRPPTTILKDTILHFDAAHTGPASIDTYFGADTPSETRAALRDGLAARNEVRSVPMLVGARPALTTH